MAPPSTKVTLAFIALFSFTIFFFFPSAVVADIRDCRVHAKVKQSLLFIEDFGFTKTLGRLQLRVTDIHFSNPNSPNLNLSNFGFFLARNDVFGHKRPPYAFPCALLRSDNLSKTIVYTFDNLNGANNFDLVYDGFNETDDYSLYFQHCCANDDRTAISFNLRTSMYNLESGGGGRRCYLSALKLHLFKVCPIFSLIYALLACLWFCILYKNRRTVSQIHILMAMVLIAKVCSLMLEFLYEFYISRTGCAQCWVSVLLPFTSAVLSGVPPVTLIAIICSGWPLVKPYLTRKDVYRVNCVININLILNVIKVVIDQSPPQEVYASIYGYRVLIFWGELLYFVVFMDFIFMWLKCRPDIEKASVSAKYLLLVRSLLGVYFCIYFCLKFGILTVIGVFFSQDYSLPYVVIWELADLILFVYVGHKVKLELYQEKLFTVDEDVEKASREFLKRVDREGLSFWCCGPSDPL